MTTILNADLHCHSVVSDGTLTPEALATRAKANGVELWALTDHIGLYDPETILDEMSAAGMTFERCEAPELPENAH